MSLAFPSTRNDVPALDSNRISRDSSPAGEEEARSASCAWSFCSGRDNELASSSTEMSNLLGLREVKINYGSPAIDPEPDSQESEASCGISEIAWEKAGGAAKVVTGVTLIAGMVAASAWSCLDIESRQPDSHACTYFPLVGVIPAAAAIAMSVSGVKQLVYAYKQGNNT